MRRVEMRGGDGRMISGTDGVGDEGGLEEGICLEGERGCRADKST